MLTKLNIQYRVDLTTQIPRQLQLTSLSIECDGTLILDCALCLRDTGGWAGERRCRYSYRPRNSFACLLSRHLDGGCLKFEARQNKDRSLEHGYREGTTCEPRLSHVRSVSKT